jgi:hypothetical protein
MSAYLKSGKIRQLVKSKGRRLGKDFLHALDVHVAEKIEAACRQHNGGRITLDRDVAALVLGKIK